MNYILSFFAAFCAASVFIGGLFMLCPEGTMTKPVKYILSLVFLLTVISAAGITVRNSDFKFEFTSPQIESDELEVNSAKFVYGYTLKKAGINYSDIEIFTTKTENGSISINKVIIYSEHTKEAVLEALGEAAKNIEVEIVNE